MRFVVRSFCSISCKGDVCPACTSVFFFSWTAVKSRRLTIVPGWERKAVGGSRMPTLSRRGKINKLFDQLGGEGGSAQRCLTLYVLSTPFRYTSGNLSTFSSATFFHPEKSTIYSPTTKNVCTRNRPSSAIWFSR